MSVEHAHGQSKVYCEVHRGADQRGVIFHAPKFESVAFLRVCYRCLDELTRALQRANAEAPERVWEGS